MSEEYAGDISPKEAWKILQNSPEAILIDVRTEAEWAWVGQVDLSSLKKEHLLVEWNRFPGGVSNENFVEDVAKLVANKEAELLMLCRSGVRSKYAAIALTAAGFKTAYNIAGGFEGDPNEERHRGQVNGWKVANLPWVQG
ncbi:Rhodanese domain protein [Candidatus Terasakiella magnetica]|uniref:Rhodanese domain protein n=1 Tax=Candidatus Terasakiella magnetica TaxID=1867952 RepID=A0A1C3RIM9_9PROT|nr:rhodanese-like domain-containing protein [Candidatus Terasakiella magnetica]SCA57122.1 Rhodanese domain protein [Candidatus Terasakiella magnetica]